MISDIQEKKRASLLYLPENGEPLSNNYLKYKLQDELAVKARITSGFSEKTRLNAQKKDEIEVATTPGTIYYEENLYRVNIEIDIDKNRTKDVIFRYCNPMKKNIFGESWLQFETSAFREQLIPCHQSMKVHPFSFGCIVGMNTYVEHFSSNWSSNKDKFYIGGVNADFMHDVKKLFLDFSVTTKEACGKNKTRTVSINYRLEILYSAILRILVQKTSEKKSSGQDRIIYHVYLKLAGAPFVKKKEKSHDDGEDDHGTMQNGSDDQYTWMRVVEFGERESLTHCPKEVIGLSRVLKMTLVDQEEGVQTKALEVIDQMYACCKFATMYFTPMDMQECRKPSVSLTVPKEYFDSLYGLKCVLSYGYEIIDELKIKGLWAKVKKKLTRYAAKNDDALANALFDIQRMLNQGQVFRFENALDYLFDKYVEKNQYDQGQKNKDYKSIIISPRDASSEELISSLKIILLRRAILTPTRLLFLPPLPQMMNYLLRACNPYYCMRLTLKDDDYDQLTFKLSGSEEKRDKFMHDNFLLKLVEGIKIGDRRYEFFGSSTSQLREHGILLYAADFEGRTAHTVRNSLGKLKEIVSVPKYMARMGQNLSQSMSSVTIKRKYCKKDVDIERNGYNFTDGVGRISRDLIEKCYKTLSLPEGQQPCALQVRYGGCKGMLVLDNTLKGKQIVFRKSQWKYDSESASLEILKFSKPRHVYLNRPFITILEQMGISIQTFVDLQSRTLNGLINSLLDSSAAAKLLKEKALLRLPYTWLNKVGFDLSTEPFFRPMIMALYRSAIEQLKCKARIEIPFSQGRTMFGVVDETGILNYGQIFVQYTETTDEGKVTNTLKVLQGEILVTKNPCMHPGDVRKLQAIDVPSLHHIVDCIVFPSNGPRPHPDEMAGSDLDGDEYSVIWYKPLYFERENHEAMDYRSDGGKTLEFLEDDSPEKRVEKMGKFFCYYIRSDAVGLIASAHLAWSDQESIFSHKCMKIAKKFSVTLDFAKSGEPAELGKEERVRCYPDFMEKISEKRTYLSNRALGVLYRNCHRIDIASNVLGDEVSVELDDDLVLDVSGEDIQKAHSVFEQFVNLMEEPAKLFCITNEGELMSGATSSVDQFLKGKNSKENLELTLESYIPKVFKQMKTKFYQEYSENEKLKKLSAHYLHLEDPVMREANCSLALSLLVSRLSRGLDKMVVAEFELNDVLDSVYRKASAWYQVAYNAKKDGKSIFIGLPWSVADVLILMKDKRKSKMEPLFMKQIQQIFDDQRDMIYSFLSLRETDLQKRMVKALLDRWLSYNMGIIMLRSNRREPEIFAELDKVFQIVTEGGLPVSNAATLVVKVLKTLGQFTFTTVRWEHDRALTIDEATIRKELGLLSVIALANLTSTGKLWGKSEEPQESNIFGCSFLDDKYREELYLSLSRRTKEESTFFDCINRHVHMVEDFMKRMSNVDDVQCDFKQVGKHWYVILSILGKRLNIELLKEYLVKPTFKDNIITSVKYDLQEDDLQF